MIGNKLQPQGEHSRKSFCNELRLYYLQVAKCFNNVKIQTTTAQSFYDILKAVAREKTLPFV
jgi:hypothetical protein